MLEGERDVSQIRFRYKLLILSMTPIAYRLHLFGLADRKYHVPHLYCTNSFGAKTQFHSISRDIDRVKS
jgi:hypothetical protein